jgi:hypothetical protein
MSCIFYDYYTVVYHFVLLTNYVPLRFFGIHAKYHTVDGASFLKNTMHKYTVMLKPEVLPTVPD